jgi:peptidoglycan/LPS O-acetylase OafA/YrhL
MKQRYVAALDPIRFVAAMAVVFYHYTFQDLPDSRMISAITQFGYLGVPLFFMISGFVISMSIQSAPSPVKFLVHRAIRLYPAFVLCLLITVIFVALCAKESVYSARELFFNMTMFGRQFGARLINGAYWSLASEWTFYFLAAASCAVLGRRRFHVFLWGWWALSVLNIFLHMGAVGRPLILGAAPLFIAGASSYMIMTGQHRPQMWRLFAGSVPVSLYWAVSDVHGLHLPSRHAEPAVIALMLLFYVLMARLALSGDVGQEPNRLMQAAGATSYPLYLLHETIGYQVLSRSYARGGPVLVAGLIVAMVVVSWLISEYYERPIRRWLKRRFDERTGAAVQAGSSIGAGN